MSESKARLTTASLRDNPIIANPRNNKMWSQWCWNRAFASWHPGILASWTDNWTWLFSQIIYFY